MSEGQCTVCALREKFASLGVLLFSSPGQSPGRAIVLPPALALALASALAKGLMLKFFI